MNKQEADLLMCPQAQLLTYVIFPALGKSVLILQLHYAIHKMRTLTCQHPLSDKLS